MTHLLECDSLYLEFGDKRVLQDIYLSCRTGEATGILGRNGSGKSCLMKIVFGTLKAYHQSVRIDGKTTGNTNIHKGYINYLPQENFIPGFLRVSEVIKQYGLDAELFLHLFNEFEQIFYQRVDTLSGGELRLLEIFIILQSPSWFSILDEPFSYLMPLHVEKVIHLIHEVKHTKGIIITDHLYKHILAVSDHLYILNNGSSIKMKQENDLIRLGYLPE